MAKEMGCKKFYLLGTDYVFPRTANKVLKAYLKVQGVPDENVMEENGWSLMDTTYEICGGVNFKKVE